MPAWNYGLVLAPQYLYAEPAGVPSHRLVLGGGFRYAAIHNMGSVVDRLNEMPPLPQRTPAPRHTGRYVLLLVAILLVANAIVGERGLVALFRANQEHARQQQVIDALHAENGRLHRYAQALAGEPRVIEDVARRELGLMKPGEQLFILRDTEAAPAPAPPEPDPHPAPATP